MKSKKARLIFLSFILINSIVAQNSGEKLDFSLIYEAPTYFSQLKLAKGWQRANSSGTPDLYHKKGGEFVGVPNNAAGTQEPFSGNSYAGIIAYSETDDENYTEYVQNKFSAPLTKGITYDITFRVSLSDNSGFAINGLGAYVSKDPAFNEDEDVSFLTASPQIISNKVIKSKTEWVEISGTYTAAGGEQYLTIGLFNAADKKITLSDAPENINKLRAYYYIDGVEFSDANLDTDKDGIINKYDKCPKEAGAADNAGCPWGDSDEDGVLDNVDKCPKIKGPAANNGCPKPVVVAPISAEAQARLNDFARAIFFNSGRSTFRPGVTGKLDLIAGIMKEYSKANFSIEGHTDSAGASAPNQRLSESRAKAVLTYLTSHGIATSRLSSVGYGEDYPIADNGTRDGRAQNRRVEIKLKK